MNNERRGPRRRWSWLRMTMLGILLLADGPWVSAVHAQAFTWTGGSGDNAWATKENWSPQQVPGEANLGPIGPGVSATIPDGFEEIWVNATVQIGAVNAESPTLWQFPSSFFDPSSLRDATIRMFQGGLTTEAPVSLQGLTRWQGGLLSSSAGEGEWGHVSGQLLIEDRPSSDIAPRVGLSNTLLRALAPVRQERVLSLLPGGRIDNASIWELQYDGPFTSGVTRDGVLFQQRFTNGSGGTIRKTGSGQVVFSVPLDNQGDIQVENGVVELWEGGVHSGGSYTVQRTDIDLGSTLSLGGIEITGDVVGTGRGTIELTGCNCSVPARDTVRIQPGARFTADVDVVQAFGFRSFGLQIDGPVRIGGELVNEQDGTWTAGSLTGHGNGIVINRGILEAGTGLFGEPVDLIDLTFRNTGRFLVRQPLSLDEGIVLNEQEESGEPILIFSDVALTGKGQIRNLKSPPDSEVKNRLSFSEGVSIAPGVSIHNEDVWQIRSTPNVVFQGGTVENEGTAHVTGNGSITIVAPAVFSNTGTFRYVPSRQDFFTVSGTFDTPGTVEVGTGTLQINGPLPQLQNEELLGGIWQIEPEGELRLPGLVLSVGPDATVRGQSGTLPQVRLERIRGGKFQATGPFDAPGKLFLQEGGELILKPGSSQQNKRASVPDGALTRNTGSALEALTFTAADTVFVGTSTSATDRVVQVASTDQSPRLVTPVLVTWGELVPGDTAAVGPFHLRGNLDLQPTGRVLVDIGGTAPLVGHDQLIVDGEATLGGTLAVKLLGGFTPAVDERFTILTCSAECTGRFEAVDAPEGYAFDVLYDTNEVTLVVAQAIPVELTAFSGIVDGGAILLTWETASETNNAGFEVQHRPRTTTTQTSPWSTLAFLEGAGTTSDPQRYQFVDRSLPRSATHVEYRLRQIDLDGTDTYSPVIRVALSVPSRFALHPSYPNPARTRATIPFDVSTTTKVRLMVYDFLGRRVETLAHRDYPPGRHALTLDTRPLSSGLYFVIAEMGSYRSVQTLTVVR